MRSVSSSIKQTKIKSKFNPVNENNVILTRRGVEYHIALAKYREKINKIMKLLITLK